MTKYKNIYKMSKYRFVYFLRTSKYSGIDNFIEQNKDKLECTNRKIGKLMI